MDRKQFTSALCHARRARAWVAAVVAVAGGLSSCAHDTGGGQGSAADAARVDGAHGTSKAADSGPTACDRVALRDFFPEAARFVPEASVSLRARVAAEAAATCEAVMTVTITDLGRVIHEETQTIAMEPGVAQTVVFRWLAPPADFIGYLAVLSSKHSQERRSTGIDISSTPLRYPRYGYLSSFPPDRTLDDSRGIVARLAQEYHLNMFQLYDWFYRHEDMIQRADDGSVAATWTDLFGRVHAWDTIRDVVDAIHGNNGFAMAYVTAYAAREGYEQLSAVSPAWGLYETPEARNQTSVAFAGERYLFLFDPANEAWQSVMAREYAEAVDEVGFDGVHIDQFGPRPTLYRADGAPVELNQTFAPFLEAIDRALEANDPMRDACVFNLVDGSVDGYAVEAVATTSACDILYSELWFRTDTYEDVRKYVEQLRTIGRNRPVVLAVYAQYGEDVGRVLEAENAAELDGVAVDTDHSGYSGTGFVDQFDEVGDAVTWTLHQDEEATVSYVFRYANATGMPATRTVVVDGAPIGKVSFGARGSWSEWAFDAWLQERLAAGEHTVRLVYAEDDVGVPNIDRLTLGEFDFDSVLLQNAVIFASGATPIQIGDDVQSLAHEYFPNRSKSLSPALQRALREQYTFITAHERLLFAPEVEPIDERLERVETTSEGHTLIEEGTGGVYTLLRRTPYGDAIHLVNLVGVDNARWRDAAPAPELQERIQIRYRVEEGRSVSHVLWATPSGTGAFEELAFDADGSHVSFEVPRLAYWDVVLVRYDD